MGYKRVVLFGAGASADSPGVLPVPPPLGAELYRVLAKAFPDSWGAFSDELRPKFEHHFETGMGALMDIYPDAVASLRPGAPSPHCLMQDLAHLFLSYRLAPGPHDLYTRFLLGLEKASKLKGICLSTLNYEHLAEDAMARLNLRPEILRPHGGCQLWMKRGGGLRGTGRAVGRGMKIISRRIRSLPANAINDLLNAPEQAQYPCMAIYVEGKVTQMGQYYLSRIQDRFARRVSAARTVVLIGVRPWPADTHIWEPVFTTSASVLYVGGERDWPELRDRRGPDRESILVGHRFAECIPDLVELM